MASVYIIVILICRVIQAFFNKRSSNEIKNLNMLIGYNAYKNSISAILGLILIIIVGNGFKVDILTVLIASFSGIALFFSCFCSIYAMKSGTICLSSMFGTAGLLIPIIAGALFFNQSVSFYQIIGVLLFFVSAFFLIMSSKTIFNGFSFKTLILLIGSLISNGCTMLAQQMFTRYVPDGDVSVFSFFSFAIIAFLSAILYLFSTFVSKKARVTAKPNKSLLLCGVALAISVFIINQLATLSTTLVSPIILFTFINGGGTIISTIVAAIVYKEKITVKTGLGIILGVVSLVIIKAFE